MKNKFKRLLSAAIAVCMLTATFVSAISVSAADSETQDDAYISHEKLLRDLGIINFDIADPEATVSRGQFVDMAMRTYYKELPEYAKASTFTDVIPNYEFKDAVESAYSNGFVQGVDDHVFGVDLMITPKAAVVIMLRILNYEEYIQAFGPYDENYLKVADRIELLKKLDMSKEVFSFKDAVQLLYNAIDIAPLKITGSEGGLLTYEKKDDNTLIYDRLGIDEIEGTVTTSFYSSLDGGRVSGKDDIKIDNDIYHAGTSGAEDYIGYKVHIYYDEDSKIIYHIEDDDTKVTELTDADSVSYKDGVLHYTKDNGSSKNIRIGSDAIVIYNGALVVDGQFDESLFDVYAGTIKVIEKSYNGHAVVLIQSYTDMVLDRTVEDDGTYALINKFDSDKNVIIDDADRFDIRDSEGNVMTIKDIPSEAVISMATALDGTSGKFKVNITTNKLTQAYVLNCNSSHVTLKTYNESIHTYDEIQYEYANDFKKLNEEKKIVKPSSEYTAYINVFGRIAYMSADKDMSDFYAYIMKVYPATESPDSGLELKLFQEDGKVATYQLKDNVVIDGKKCKNLSNDEITRMLIGNETESDPSKYTKSRLAYISLTYDSKVKSIDTCLEETPEREDNYTGYKMDREAEDTLYKIDGGDAAYAPTIPGRRRYSSETKAMDTGILLSSSTKIFAIPRDSDDDNRFKILTTASLLNDRLYEVKAYGRDDDTIAPDVLLYFYYSRYSSDIDTAEPNSQVRIANLPFERTYDADTGICTECVEEVNPETDDVEMAVSITNIRTGAATKFFTDDETLTDGIAGGQLVRYYALGGSLCYLEKLYSIPDKQFNENSRVIKWNNTKLEDGHYTGNPYVMSYFLMHDGTYLSDNNSSQGTENPVYGVARGVIMNSNTTQLAYVTYDNYEKGNVTENYWKPYTCSSTKVYRFNERDNSLEVKKFSDLIAYNESSLKNSEVVIVTKNKAAIGIIVY